MGAILVGKADGGVREALQLDDAARDLDRGRAAGGENRDDGPVDAEAAQLGLFAGVSLFGEVRESDGRSLPAGPGRPRGSRNRTTKELVRLITSHGRHPLIAMAEIVAMPLPNLAARLNCKLLEAAEFQRKVMGDLAPYVAQKLPTAVQIEGANAGMLVINLGGPLGEAVKGLDMRLAAGAVAMIEGEQNQEFSDDDGAASHDAPSHEQDR